MSSGRLVGPAQASLGTPSGIPGTAGNVGSRLFGGDLGAAARAYGNASAPFTPGANTMQGRQGGLRDFATGTNVSIGTGPAAALLKGNNVANSGWEGIAPVTADANTFEPTNAPITMPRFLAADFAHNIPGDDELVFIKRPTAAAKRPIDQAKKMNPWGAGGNDLAETKMDALIGYNVQALNKYLFESGLELFRTNVDRYQKLTPLEVWQGCDDADLKWTGWTLDGGVRLEEMRSGAASAQNDGYGSYTPFNIVSRTKNAPYPQKLTTVTRSGRCRLKDIFYSKGLRPGARLYLILTKKAWTAKIAAHQVTFTTTTKAGTIAEGASVTKSVTSPPLASIKAWGKDGSDEREMYEAVVTPYMGFQLCGYVAEDGGEPPMSFKCYKDEWGVPHYDALVLCIGTQLHPQFASTPQPGIRSPDQHEFSPIVDGTNAMIRPLIPDVLLNPYKDGVLSLL
jgi:hypothetical protein